MIAPPSRREWAILAATVCLILLPLLALGTYLVQKYQSAQASLAAMEPRHARLAGLDHQRDEIAQMLKRTADIRAAYVYPASQDAVQAGNAEQQKVRDLLTKAGLTIVSSQVLPPKEENGFDRISLSVRAEGELLAVNTALSVLGEQLPVIFIANAEMASQLPLNMGNNAPKTAPMLTLQLNLGVLRERQ